MNIPIRTKEEPGKDFWIIVASNEQEAEAILKKKIMDYYNLTEDEYLNNDFKPKQELKIKL